MLVDLYDSGRLSSSGHQKSRIGPRYHAFPQIPALLTALNAAQSPKHRQDCRHAHIRSTVVVVHFFASPHCFEMLLAFLISQAKFCQVRAGFGSGSESRGKDMVGIAFAPLPAGCVRWGAGSVVRFRWLRCR